MSFTHGLASTYRNPSRNFKPGCRCKKCREANTKRARAEQRRRAKRLVADPTLAPHGRYSTYVNWDCRCKLCAIVHVNVCAAYYVARKQRMAEKQNVLLVPTEKSPRTHICGDFLFSYLSIVKTSSLFLVSMSFVLNSLAPGQFWI